MSEEVKKISFGFSKLSKKTIILGQNKVNEAEKVQFIECVEEKSIKVRDEDKREKQVLIIPLINKKVSESNSHTIKTIIDSGSKNGVDKGSELTPCVVETLDSIAAKEILADVSKSIVIEETPKIFAVPLTTNAPTGENESSLDDYENVPVSDYGLAMLRGMGWCPGKGIGKNEKLVKSAVPVLRPKGMGLGADKVIKSTPNLSVENEELKLVKSAFVRIIAGPHKDSYGQIEGFDEESGRLFIKLSLKNTVLSFNEFMIQVVSKDDFIKNSKVINVAKYEEYKSKENKVDKQNSPSINNKSEPERTSSKNEDSSIKHKSNIKHSSKSYRDRSSSYDSPQRETTIGHHSHYKNKRTYRDRSNSNNFPSQQRRNQSSSSDSSPERYSRSRTHSSNSKHKKSHTYNRKKDKSPCQKSSYSRYKDDRFNSKGIKSHREQSNSDDSSPRYRRKRSRSRSNRRR